VTSLGIAITLAACGGGDNQAGNTAGSSSTGGTGFNTGGVGSGGSSSPNGGSGTYSGAIHPKRLAANNDNNVLIVSTKTAYIWGGMGVSADTASYQKVAAAGFESCGLATGGAIHCWSAKLKGREPQGTFVDLGATDYAVCGLDASGKVTCNASSGAPSNEPLLSVPTDSFASIDLRQDTGCGILKAGGIKCWGDSGAASGFDFLAPTARDFVAAYAGSASECGLYGDGYVDCWGLKSGQWPTTGGFIQIAMSDTEFDCNCALHQDGHVACWGLQCSGLAAPAGVKFVEIAVGSNSACGIVQDGTVQCWGSSATQPAAGTKAF